eukprot:CAMPEP_0167746124 /NCGR_PEP_ID=MMETSP0110_2-20121227/3536_1 /TAXON_ID=629695 /ORGANISM="Gymnochlora sp., Strain CCMP2014" /LENGTH=84 /DNA_ID=CAMNT_0007630849 /DNA_START=301 /DNA_END=555 /DNA_ORIENTATION=+
MHILDLCEAIEDCTWCTAGAVPSNCFEKEHAKNLPPGVFNCDLFANNNVEEVKAGAVEEPSSCFFDKIWRQMKTMVGDVLANLA